MTRNPEDRDLSECCRVSVSRADLAAPRCEREKRVPEALEAGASTEHLGGGLRPEIASTGDLIAMSAALRRQQDLRHIPALRRILELEADPAAIVKPTPVGVEQLHPGLPPGATLDGEISHLDRARRSGPGSGPGLGR
jgi:hypothetical protein